VRRTWRWGHVHLACNDTLSIDGGYDGCCIAMLAPSEPDDMGGQHTLYERTVRPGQVLHQEPRHSHITRNLDKTTTT
jgi:hypothetical protein